MKIVSFCCFCLLSFFSYASAANLMQSEIDHVVILMMENRSFDNVLAWLYDNDTPNQFIPADSLPEYLGLKEEELNLYTNTLKNSKGEIVFSCAPIKGVPSVSNTPFLNSPKFDPNEPFSNVTTQIFGQSQEPTMKGFLQDYATLWNEGDWLKERNDISAVMETYTAKEMPVLYALAKHYAVSDHWFASVPSQTNPNRAFAFCGTSEGEINNGPLGKSLFHADTVWNRLNEESKETTWSIFWQGDLVPVIFPGPLSGTNTFDSFRKISDYEKHFVKFDSFHEQARKGELPDISFIEPLWTLSDNISDLDVDLFEHLGLEDLILGVQGNDLHPPGEIRCSENLLANIYTSLTANPEKWERTLLVITFDEHGGLFDHVIPPSAVPPDDHTQNGFAFDRYGVRVATLFISPKIGQSVVMRSNDPYIPFDHTSLIATLLKWKGIDKSKWKMGRRVDVAPTFDPVIMTTTARTDTILADGKELPLIDPQKVIQMGESFYLKDSQGRYLTKEGFLGCFQKEVLQFGRGSGDITHGAFVFIEKEDQILESSLDDYYCYFANNQHCPNQWWTVKNVDYPYVGMKIQDGDKIYLENHVYLDLFKYIPARLWCERELLGNSLMTKSIDDPDADNCYWIIEKVRG